MNWFDRCPPPSGYPQNPYPLLDHLRKTCPLYYQAERNAWFISDYHVAGRVLRDDRFASTDASSFSDISAVFRSSIVRQLRKFFAPPHPAFLQRLVERAVDSEFQHLLAEGEGDLVAGLAKTVPIQVICELLGIPESDGVTLGKLADLLLQSYGLVCDGREHTSSAPKIFLHDYFRKHLATTRKGKNPTALMSVLLGAQHDHQLPEESLIDTCTKLLSAGATTTAGCLANVLERCVRSDQHSNQFAWGGDSVALGHIVEEVVRLNSPVLAIKRVATRNVPFAGAAIESGQNVILLTASANRDPAIFASPNEIGGTAQLSHHLSFGQGRHFCLGAPLARLELSHVLARVLPFLKKFRTQGAASWREAWLVHEPRKLEVVINGGGDIT